MILGKIKGVMMSSLKTKIGALLIKKALKTQLKSMDASEHGGAPLIMVLLSRLTEMLRLKRLRIH